MNSNMCKECWAFYYCYICPAYLILDSDLIKPTLNECEYVKNVTEVNLSKFLILIREYPKVYEGIKQRYRDIFKSGNIIRSNKV